MKHVLTINGIYDSFDHVTRVHTINDSVFFISIFINKLNVVITLYDSSLLLYITTIFVQVVNFAVV